MKFAVQPYGATMQPPAETPGLCTPGHSVLSAAAATVAVPWSASWALTEEVRNLAGGLTRSLADAVPAVTEARTHAHAIATVGLKRIRFLPRTNGCEGGAPRSAPRMPQRVPAPGVSETRTFRRRSSPASAGRAGRPA